MGFLSRDAGMGSHFMSLFIEGLVVNGYSGKGVFEDDFCCC